MKRVFLSHRAVPPLREYLRSEGYTPEFLEDDLRFGKGVSDHADLRMCRMGARPGSRVLFADAPPAFPEYPYNAAWCAVCLDRYFIHRLDITAPALSHAAEALGLSPVNVRQGYTKCSCVVVDGSSVITSDPGIHSVLSRLEGVSVLKVRPGFISLPGFDTGFIGGASGLLNGKLVFNGDLSLHPDYEAIKAFTRERDVPIVHFEGYTLADIGSIVDAAYQ